MSREAKWRRRRRLVQRLDHLDVGNRKQSSFSSNASGEPVVVHLLLQLDDVALLECELVLVLRIEIVESLTAGLARWLVGALVSLRTGDFRGSSGWRRRIG